MPDTPPSGQQPSDSRSPWLGLASYSESDSDRFFGRDAEIAELARRVDQHTLTVLFSQSGLGKTSLLRAGLLPVLRRNHFLPVFLRLDHSEGAAPLLEQVWQAIDAELSLHGRYAADGRADAVTLWEWFHDLEDGLLHEQLRGVTPVLILDQFEEIFTLGATQGSDPRARDRFLEACADLAENRVPRAVEDRIESDEQDVATFDFEKTTYRILIALREDYLSQLDRARNIMPSLMQNRMPLNRLTGRQALAPVRRPAGDLLDAEVAERIVRFVGGEDELPIENIEIEPSLLSLVCSELNRNRIEAGQDTISSELLGGNRETILEQYYEDCFSGLEPKVRHFVEDRLLTESGYRNSEALENARIEVGEEPVMSLVNARLLHIDQRGRTKRIELTHDVLTKVIVRSRDRRREVERRKAAEDERHLAEERERKTRQQQARHRAVALVMTGLFIMSVIAALLAHRARKEAEMARLVSVDIVKSLSGEDMVRNFKKLGQLAKLDAFYEGALEDLKQYPRSGGRDELEAVLRQERGSIVLEDSRPEEALEQFEQARELLKGRKGPSWDLLRVRGDRLRALANVKSNRLEQADELYHSALTLGRELHDSPAHDRDSRFAERACDELARVLDSYAEMLMSHEGEGRLSEATGYIKESLMIREHQCAEGQIKSGELAAARLRLGGALRMSKEAQAREQATRLFRLVVVEVDPMVEKSQQACAGSINELVQILLKEERPDEAVKFLQEQIARFESEAEKNPKQPGPRRLLAVSRLQLGQLHSRLGEFDDASRRYERALAAFEDAHSLDPRNVELQQSSLGARRAYISYLKKRGAFDVANEQYDLLIAEREELRLQVPDNSQVRYQLAMDYDSYGALLRDQPGRLDDANEQYRNGKKVREEFIGEFKGKVSSVWMLDLSRSYNYMGNYAYAREDYSSAYKEYERARKIRSEFYEAAPDDPIWQSRLAFCEDRLGKVAHAAAMTERFRQEAWATLERAQEKHARALDLRQRVQARFHNENSSKNWDSSTSHMNVGRVLFDQGQREEAGKHFEKAREIRVELLKGDQKNPRYLAGNAASLLWLAVLSPGDGGRELVNRAHLHLKGPPPVKIERELQGPIDRAKGLLKLPPDPTPADTAGAAR